LGHVLGQVRVAANLTQRGGMDEIDVPLNQLSERILRVFAGVFAQQIAIGQHLHLLPY
jgi:hypothetical protein